MKLKFKNPKFQPDSVNAIADFFKGQEKQNATLQTYPAIKRIAKHFLLPICILKNQSAT